MSVDITDATCSISFPSNPLLDNIWNGGATLSFWMCVDGYGGNGNGRVVGKRHWEVITRESTKTLRFRVKVVGSDGQWELPANFLESRMNQWMHIVITYDSSDYENVPSIYVDGEHQTVEVIQQAFGTIDDDSGFDFIIGNRFDENREVAGKIEDVRIYTKIFSADNITNIYLNKGIDSLVDSLLISYPCIPEGAPGSTVDEGSICYDHGPNSIHGSYLNFPQWGEIHGLRRKRFK